MQVSPDDSHMAFVTASQVTQYDNAGHLEMYSYEPSTRNVVCVSCIPSGAPPTSDVGASQDGFFMTNDGRIFFTTNDALVHADTNEAEDVYEYVDGRPQLITPGTGETRSPGWRLSAYREPPGLIGVSADGATSTSRPTTPWSARTTMGSSSSSTTRAPAAASRTAAAAALRSRRRVPRRRQLAAGVDAKCNGCEP